MKKLLVPILLLLLVGGYFLMKPGQDKTAALPEQPPVTVSEPIPEPIVEEKKEEKLEPKKEEPKPTPIKKAPAKPKKTVKKPAPPKPAAPAVKPPPEMVPPPVKIHKELIPENIEIARVYYESDFTGPGTTVGFDINGSGFTDEFEKMITVDPGHPSIKVANFSKRTPNQIHGELIVGEDVPTKALFPQVLIQDKVVFRAQRPYAVIRPGEVLNLVFVEMGQSGRSGRFRVYTNLNEKMYKTFSMKPSTSNISISDVKTTLPYIIDAKLNIGPVPTGNYGLSLLLKDKIIWKRDGLIRIVRPNVGGSGLAQRLVSRDGFHRPGDKAQFAVQGSGFRPGDAKQLQAKVAGWDSLSSTFTFVAPGRMDLEIKIPASSKEGAKSIEIFHGEESILKGPSVFAVVGKNWSREIRVDPPLTPGGESKLILVGRDFDKSYISSIKIKVDDPNLKIDPFKPSGRDRAVAKIVAGSSVLPGDYWIKMVSDKGPVLPQFGSIIKVKKK